MADDRRCSVLRSTYVAAASGRRAHGSAAGSQCEADRRDVPLAAHRWSCLLLPPHSRSLSGLSNALLHTVSQQVCIDILNLPQLSSLVIGDKRRAAPQKNKLDSPLLPPNIPYYLWTDNAFTSLPLAQALLPHNIYLHGIMRPDRNGIPGELLRASLPQVGNSVVFYRSYVL